MASESMGLLARKLGMTQFFDADGDVVPCTVLEAGPCTVLQVKTTEGKDGYNAIQLGFDSQKPARISKAQKGHFAKAGVTEKLPRIVREIRIGKDIIGNYTAGQKLGASDVFTEGQIIDVIGTSKGRGFAGVMKKFHFKGFIRSHGTHEYFRHGGSIGTRLTPGMVMAGKKMPGQHGNKQTTVHNMKLAKIDAERNLIYVRGGVPGPVGGMVTIRAAVKKR
jgi:large subunit ribosomal protein L3